MYQKLDELIGPNQWSVTVDYPNYTLYIESSALNQSYATEVAFTINRIKPAHIVYINKPYVQTGLLLSEIISLSQLEYNYRLGGWGLGLLPFATENSMGVIKTATTPSIQQQLLEDVANFTSNDIVSAQVNGSIAISSINKSVSGSTCTVTYSVSPSQTTEITSVSLLDSEGNPLAGGFILAWKSIGVGYTGALMCWTVVFTPIGTACSVVLSRIVDKSREENTSADGDGIKYAAAKAQNFNSGFDVSPPI